MRLHSCRKLLEKPAWKWWWWREVCSSTSGKSLPINLMSIALLPILHNSCVWDKCTQLGKSPSMDPGKRTFFFSSLNPILQLCQTCTDLSRYGSFLSLFFLLKPFLFFETWSWKELLSPLGSQMLYSVLEQDSLFPCVHSAVSLEWLRAPWNWKLGLPHPSCSTTQPRADLSTYSMTIFTLRWNGIGLVE